jgi:hypothetical protein
MTVIASWVDELENDAQVLRQAIGSLIGAAGGTVGAGGLAVTQKPAPDLHVLIAGGTPEEGGCWIPGYTASTGIYYFQNSASFELPIAAASATNPRIDRIVARVYDNAVDSLGKHEAKFEAIVGTAESGASLGNLKGEAALPKNCLTLAHVLVPANATAIVTADILAASTLASVTLAQTVGETSGTTYTLPAPDHGRVASFICGAAATSIKIKQHGADKIYGDSVNAASEITLATLQHVALWSNGTNWFIIAGEPKREGFWGVATPKILNTENTPSTTRPTMVTVHFQVGASGELWLFCQTVRIAKWAGLPTGTPLNYQFYCPAGATWKAEAIDGTALEANYLTL